jgi:sRNA-binding regulator protein Hfq
MHDTSALPVRRVEDALVEGARSPKPTDKTPDASGMPSIQPAGPRKLVRPRMPAGMTSNRFPNHLAAVISLPPDEKSRVDNSHSEAFYLQKQINSQTRMVFVLEEGEAVEGQIEWYDRNAIKIKNGPLRTLIYKTSIKYLYKATESAAR